MSNIRITKNLVSKPVTPYMVMMGSVKCSQHSYKLSVTVIGSPIENRNDVKFGMVIDFTDLKKSSKKKEQFDHATVLTKRHRTVELAKELINRGHHVILVDYQPTSENMVVDFSKELLPDCQKDQAFFLKLQETESSFAEWYASDNL
jgi:6-pyruvoyltetrahydropterin/6-carboxytetrahydropterin synthase